MCPLVCSAMISSSPFPHGPSFSIAHNGDSVTSSQEAGSVVRQPTLPLPSVEHSRLPCGRGPRGASGILDICLNMWPTAVSAVYVAVSLGSLVEMGRRFHVCVQSPWELPSGFTHTWLDAPSLLAGNGLLIPLESAGPLGGPPPGVTPCPPSAYDKAAVLLWGKRVVPTLFTWSFRNLLG